MPAMLTWVGTPAMHTQREFAMVLMLKTLHHLYTLCLPFMDIMTRTRHEIFRSHGGSMDQMLKASHHHDYHHFTFMEVPRTKYSDSELPGWIE